MTMRRYLQLVEGILTEAPLADFGSFGDLEKEGSFRDQDLKAIRNDRWVQKLHTQFANFPFKLNVYVYNGKDGIVQIGGTTVNTRDFQDLRAKIVGVAPAHRVRAIIGKMPPEMETSINAILVDNEGAARHPFTPWILAHRIAHALIEGGTSRNPGLRNPELEDGHACLIDVFNDVMRGIKSRLSAIDDFEHLTNWFSPGLTSEGVKDIAKLVGTMRSARSGNLTNGGEFLVEMMAQVMIQGRVSFVVPEFEDRDGYGPSLGRYLDRAAERMTADINQMFQLCIGKVVIL